jgi:hypothetical protein
MDGIDDFDDEPTEPEEGDIVTEDHVNFYQDGKRVLRVRDGDDWQDAVRQYMEADRFWPNVWWISDHGNPYLLSIPQEA